MKETHHCTLNWHFHCLKNIESNYLLSYRSQKFLDDSFFSAEDLWHQTGGSQGPSCYSIWIRNLFNTSHIKRKDPGWGGKQFLALWFILMNANQIPQLHHGINGNSITTLFVCRLSKALPNLFPHLTSPNPKDIDWAVPNRSEEHRQGPLSYTIYKNKLKMDEEPKCETWNQKTPRNFP